jgi:hypothetical protein
LFGNNLLTLTLKKGALWPPTRPLRAPHKRDNIWVATDK